MAQAQLAARQPITSYWDLAQKLTTIDDCMTWCNNKGLLGTQHDCQCESHCRIVKRTRYPGKNIVASTSCQYTYQ